MSAARLPILALLVFLGAASPAALAATPDLPPGWEQRQADGLVIHHRPSGSGLAAALAGEAPAIRRQVAAVLGTDPRVPVDVVLVPAGREGQGTHIPEAPHWASGFTVPGSGVLFIREASLGVYPDRGLASVFAHELAHVELGRLAGARRLPRWFEEGSCMVLARPWDLRDSFSLTLALLFGRNTPFENLELAFPEDQAGARAAYARSFAFVAWLVDNGRGTPSLGRVAALVGEGNTFPAAFAREYGVHPARAAAVWSTSSGRWYRLISGLSGTTFFWLVIIALVLLTALRRRRRNRAILERWEQEDGPQPPSAEAIEP